MLISTPVVVAIDHGHDESMGAFTTFITWDGESLGSLGGMYSGLAYNAYAVNATAEQIEAAASCYQRENRSGKLMGATVTLKRSRKAANGVPLLVTGIRDAFNDAFTGHSYPEMVEVIGKTGEPTLVSSSCVNEVLLGARPWWG